MNYVHITDTTARWHGVVLGELDAAERFSVDGLHDVSDKEGHQSNHQEQGAAGN